MGGIQFVEGTELSKKAESELTDFLWLNGDSFILLDTGFLFSGLQIQTGNYTTGFLDLDEVGLE